MKLILIQLPRIIIINLVKQLSDLLLKFGTHDCILSNFLNSLFKKWKKVFPLDVAKTLIVYVVPKILKLFSIAVSPDSKDVVEEVIFGDVSFFREEVIDWILNCRILIPNLLKYQFDKLLSTQSFITFLFLLLQRVVKQLKKNFVVDLGLISKHFSNDFPYFGF